MGNSFQFIDIIFFAMIAIFLILRLRGVLGKRGRDHNSGFLDLFKQDNNLIETDSENKTNNVVKLSEEILDEKPNVVSEGENDKFNDSNNNKNLMSAKISQVQKYDATFDEEDFLVGAHVAFEIILTAFASADMDELKPLVSDEVYGNFAKAIQDREQAGHVMEDTLVGINKSEMVEAYMEDDNAFITIKFVSEQVNAIRDENGDVVEGDANVILTVTDFWTFARDTTVVDPNWLLVATRSLE
jgi:predicted lipid-binding transport protein (Tim44 family)